MSLATAGSLNFHAILDNLTPGAHEAHLGGCIYDLINNHNALLAKLDAANLAGVGNTNVATLSVLLPEQR